jgi:hypothetical protein
MGFPQVSPSRSGSFIRMDSSGLASSGISMSSSNLESRRNSLSEENSMVLPSLMAEMAQRAHVAQPSNRRPSLTPNRGRASPMRRPSTTPMIPETNDPESSRVTNPLDNPYPRSPSRGRAKRFSLGTAWHDMKEIVMSARSKSPESDNISYPGRGGAGSSRSRPRSAGGTGPLGGPLKDDLSRGRDRTIAAKFGDVFGAAPDNEPSTEFKKGMCS